jgi:hypothetical protein
MKKIILNTVIAVFFACSCKLSSSNLPQGQATSHSSKQRDLISYEKFGPVIVKSIIGGEERAKILAEIRNFLWRKWSQRSLGYLIVSYESKEGDLTVNSLFVEKLDELTWVINIESKDETEGVLHQMIGTKIERISTYTDKPIDLEEKLSSPEYKLVIKNNEGKILQVW